MTGPEHVTGNEISGSSVDNAVQAGSVDTVTAASTHTTITNAVTFNGTTEITGDVVIGQVHHHGKTGGTR